MTFDSHDLPEYKPLSAYGLIGDGRTAALIGADGSIDWACFPDFASPACFAALLDPQAGFFALRPQGRFQSEQAYEPGTNILVTEFRTAHGRARLTDLMPEASNRKLPSAEIHRKLEVLEGSIDLELRFAPRPNFAQEPLSLEVSPYGAWVQSPSSRLALASPLPLELDGNEAKAQARLNANDELWWVLDWGAHRPHPVASYQPERRLEGTRARWLLWSRQLRYHGRYREALERSLLTLRLLFYEPTGAFVAAPTTSLPEWPGGPRNWDYRYSWVRDSSFILEALLKSGYLDEGTAYFDWMLYQVLEGGPLQVVYGVHGERELPEATLPLRGYRDSRPVRIGNGAVTQRQLDIYGSLLEAAWTYVAAGGILTPNEWEGLEALVEEVIQSWRKPDAGLWERRSEEKHHTYSKLGCWIALDRACRLAQQLSLDAPLERWAKEARAIREEVLERAWNPKVSAFTEAYGEDGLDAAVLALALKGLVEVHDPRFQATVEAIQRELAAGPWPLLYRYRSEDGINTPEGAFLLPSFWLVEVLALMGRRREARQGLERLLSWASPLGLFSEEIHPETGELLGNFPQGFSHLGLVHAILRLAEGHS